ncbi:hypothetical protein CBW54_22385 [Yersinia kristensenii]|nr:hypothetical protein CBW54_22385 [Yersinia kristensenii]
MVGSVGSAGAHSFSVRSASTGPAVRPDKFIDKTPSNSVTGRGQNRGQSNDASKQKIVEEVNEEFGSDIDLRQPAVSYDGRTSMNTSMRILKNKVLAEQYSDLTQQ